MPVVGASRFSEKLNELPETIDLALAADQSVLASALRESAGRPVLAVGSGGSAVTASYFARCRETLFAGITSVITPAELTVGLSNLEDVDVWLFSAGANNADFRGALKAARVRHARRVNILTRRPDAAETLSQAGTPTSVHVLPVASEKDSFLATHSLVSSVSALFAASNLIISDPAERIIDAYRSAATAELAQDHRKVAADAFDHLRQDDTLLLIADPQLGAIATLLETSLWEASICAVQRTDVRNFAHGRHTWLHHHSDRSFILALVGDDTRDAWRQTNEAVPHEIRRVAQDFGACGRLENAIGIMRGLAWIEAMGEAVGIDPGKPGIGEFGRALYNDDALEMLSEKLGPAVRQKRRAKLERDDPERARGGIHSANAERLARLSSASIGAIVFDYDGTIVETQHRFDPPADCLIDELKRLHGLGIRLAIATGRGGSAGETLREALPKGMHPDVVMGYYNGGYIKQLDVDIRDDPPEQAPEILETATWLLNRRDLVFESPSGEHSLVQISIRLDRIPDIGRFNREVQSCGPVANKAVRFVRSGHSLDIVPSSSSKRNVVERVADGLAGDVVVLKVGDQGARGGNDHELLTDPYGISVKEVCGRDDGCWSLFGAELTGPDALLKLLRAVQPGCDGRVRLNIDELALDGK